VRFIPSGRFRPMRKHDDRVHLGRPVRIGQGGLQVLQLGGDSAHGAGPIHHLGNDAAAGHLAHILAEVADRDAPVGRDLAFGRAAPPR
jgi:hypothetical protein